MRPLLLSVCLVVSLFFSVNASAEQAFNFFGRLLPDGQFFSLDSLGNRPKVINFFWVNCVPCREEMPELAELEKHYPQVDFLALHKGPESLDKINAFIKTLDAAPKRLIKAEAMVVEKYRADPLPYTVLVDKNGDIADRIVGYTPANMQQLKRWLKQVSE
jgi:thiol-disulfide isomerase/thioredoxin